MADDFSRFEGGIEWVTIHHPEADGHPGGQAEITRASWDEPTDESVGYASFEERGWKLGSQPVRRSRAAAQTEGASS